MYVLYVCAMAKIWARAPIWMIRTSSLSTRMEGYGTI
jgi:hypothetical protein